jgi:hypothetical protein
MNESLPTIQPGTVIRTRKNLSEALNPFKHDPAA